ncbi:hypothetical protein ANCCEY_12926 [Ancylostoma ceylanicum]|uniref:Serine aminopeptidase S33 domain-containing protein n=2 Tax=Ancylostoma ceylanicum TaxID=53326 RepID=A0A0D6L9Z6_9BILA|nr:hypothetical protein ANCCEY_12926 [Ancylostoma ceylanicum]EYB88662.1 hypothetical protein Y032_0243g3487 [Ancylostoma ceylanicum]
MREVLNILYCHGLGSSINNRVGTGLVEYFRNTPHYFERLLYRNPGSRHIPWNISEWREDIEKRVEGSEWVVIASSAGCHAALNAAKNRPNNIKGLFLFCPGVALTFNYVNTLIPGGSTALQNGQSLIHPASRGGHEALINRDCLQHYLDTCVTNAEGLIDIRCPVSIVHGTLDEMVPFENSISMSKRLRSPHVELTLVPGGTHFLSVDQLTAEKLNVFLATIARLKDSPRRSSSKM